MTLSACGQWKGLDTSLWYWDLVFFAFLGGYEWVLDSHLINNAAFVVLSMAHWLCRQQSRCRKLVLSKATQEDRNRALDVPKDLDRNKNNFLSERTPPPPRMLSNIQLRVR